MNCSDDIINAALRLARNELCRSEGSGLERNLDALCVIAGLAEGDEAHIAANSIHHIKEAEAAQRQLFLILGGPSKV